MTPVVRRLRGALVAFVALALSAGAALAGGGAAPPEAAQPGLDRAHEASGKLVPVRAGWTEPEEEVEEPSELVVEEAEAEENEESEVDPDNHGTVVSEAAQSETPEGYRNHGEYVSEVARDNHGQEAAAKARAERGHGGPPASTERGAPGR